MHIKEELDKEYIFVDELGRQIYPNLSSIIRQNIGHEVEPLKVGDFIKYKLDQYGQVEQTSWMRIKEIYHFHEVINSYHYHTIYVILTKVQVESLPLFIQDL